MNDLAEVLREQAASSRPRPDLDDALHRAHTRRRQVVARRTSAIAAAVLVVVVGSAVVVTQRSGHDRNRAVVAGAAPGLPALVIGAPPQHALDRHDSGAQHGPWTAVVRRSGGSLGSHGAVVTFPVVDVPAGDDVIVNGKVGHRGDDQVVWPIVGAYARVRGDVGAAALLDIARHTAVVDGRPVVRTVTGFSTVFTGPYRAPDVHEVRYGSAALGEGAALGNGLAYTGVLRAGGFEDQLYATHARSGGRVGGHPTMLSSVQGGNGTLAWELSPGVVAYMGYSGSTLGDQAGAALDRLAERTRVVSPAAWQTMHPQVSEQVNDFG